MHVVLFATLLHLSGGYRMTLPTDPGQIRHALFIEGALPVGRLVELTLATELATEPTGVAAAGEVTLLDVPLRTGARFVLQRGRLRFGAGPLVSLHVLDATRVSFAAGRSDDVRVTVGLGADAVLQIVLSPRRALISDGASARAAAPGAPRARAAVGSWPSAPRA